MPQRRGSGPRGRRLAARRARRPGPTPQPGAAHEEREATDYKLRTHDLTELAKQSAPLHPALAGALPRDTTEDERLFVLLRKAYIEARYAMNYRISMADLEALRARTLDLGARVREACVAQLGVLGAAR